MNLYMSSTLMWGFDFETILQRAYMLGLKGVEICTDQFWFQQESPDHILAFKKELGLDVTVHAPIWDINLCSQDQRMREYSFEAIKQSFELAVNLEADNVTVHPGRLTFVTSQREQQLQWLNQQLQALAMEAEKYYCFLSLEHMKKQPFELICTPEQINHLLQDLPDHVYSTFNMANVPMNEELLDYYLRMNRVSKIQFNDRNKNRYRHLPISPFLRECQKTDLPIILEGFDDSMSQLILQKHIEQISTAKNHSFLGVV